MIQVCCVHEPSSGVKWDVSFRPPRAPLCLVLFFFLSNPVEVVPLLTSQIQTALQEWCSAAEITWILKLSGFSLCFSFIVSDSALNQPPQSECLDFVLCILFSYTPLPSSPKGVFYQNQLFEFMKLQKLIFLFFFSSSSNYIFFLLLFVWHLAHVVGALKVQVVICSLQVRNLHKNVLCSITGNAMMMLNCIVWETESLGFSWNCRKIRKSFFLFFFFNKITLGVGVDSGGEPL